VSKCPRSVLALPVRVSWYVPDEEHPHKTAVLKTACHHLNNEYKLQTQFYIKVTNSKVEPVSSNSLSRAEFLYQQHTKQCSNVSTLKTDNTIASNYDRLSGDCQYTIQTVITQYKPSLHYINHHYTTHTVITLYKPSLHYTNRHYTVQTVSTLYRLSLHYTNCHYPILTVITLHKLTSRLQKTNILGLTWRWSLKDDQKQDCLTSTRTFQ
jgi:hypothetical protein